MSRSDPICLGSAEDDLESAEAGEFEEDLHQFLFTQIVEEELSADHAGDAVIDGALFLSGLQSSHAHKPDPVVRRHQPCRGSSRSSIIMNLSL